ncbi:B12-binding domain-containing radical SAM protein [Desulfopila aestuarii]|nr:radical SAM protein [Desulfopila aestuarii]
MHILLLHPPQAKPAEPPAGLPLLAATLRAHGCSCSVCDFNIEGLSYLIDREIATNDTWSRRAAKNRHRHLASLNETATYENPDKYIRAVADINRFLENCGNTQNIQISLANYQDPYLSPLKSDDLLQQARNFQENLFFSFFEKRLRDEVAETSPTHIGISLNYLSQALCTFAILGFLRKEFPNIILILGGGLVTTWLQSPGWHNPFDELVDYMIAGPGEEQLVELLTGSLPVRRVSPDYSDFRRYSYLAPGFILPYAASTGCFWRKCSFCPETSERNRYHPVTPDMAMTELEQLIRDNQPSLVHFLDNAISPAMLHLLADSPLGVPWYGFVRFTKELADPQFCRRLRRSGCVMLKLGLESGSQEILDRMNKGIDLQLVAQVLEALAKAGIGTYIYLLFGTPGESLTEARQTFDFVRQHHHEIHFLNLAIFNLPIGSREIDELQISDFYEGDLSIYCDFHHPRGWNRREIRRFLESEFKREPVIHSILQNDPIHFTSNHAPFFMPRLIRQ